MEHTAEQNLREVERGAAMDLPTSKTLDADQKANKESDYYRRNLLPVDRGWAWVICFCEYEVAVSYETQVPPLTFIIWFRFILNLWVMAKSDQKTGSIRGIRKYSIQ